MMIIKAKYKICKRLGAGVFEKCQTQKFTLSEARSERAARGKKRGGRGGRSEFGTQLIEKQKARFLYGLSERQFSNYVKSAVEKKGTDSVKSLTRSLEGRLDNAVYRLGFASTRRHARQLVSHGHFTVNGRKVTVPSYKLSTGDVISVREGSKGRTAFTGAAERLVNAQTPSWLKLTPEALSAKVVGDPSVEGMELLFDPTLVLQFYSR